MVIRNVSFQKRATVNVALDILRLLLDETKVRFNGLEVRYLLWAVIVECKGSRVRIPVGPVFANPISMSYKT
jgi:hypothetical protein